MCRGGLDRGQITSISKGHETAMFQDHVSRGMCNHTAPEQILLRLPCMHALFVEVHSSRTLPS